jgi:glutamyl-tRNA reductase
MTRSLVNKFLHRPVQAIKAAASEGNTAAVEAIREAFGTTGSRENEGEDDLL